MAIYFPRLFCDIGQKLIVRDNIVFDGGTTIAKGEICIVKNIKGYGFDIASEKDRIEFRIMNSEMGNNFLLFFPNIPSEIKVKSTITNLVNALTGKETDDSNKNETLNKFRDVLMFTKDFAIKDTITIPNGERFYYEEDDGYYDLFDVKDDWRLLRMKEKEVQEFCQFQNAMANEKELV